MKISILTGIWNICMAGEELVTNYGKLDILWFDFSYDNMCEDTWKAEELIRMVRKHQPDVIIDNRLEGSGEKNGSIVTDHPNIYSGDFASPEMIIPPGGMKDLNGKPIPWELCATMNNHWGYCYYDHTYKHHRPLSANWLNVSAKAETLS